MDKVFIIAEAGVNHNAELKKGYELVNIAYEANADAVKFQTFQPGECTGIFAIKVDYLKKSSQRDETRYSITKNLALPYSDFLKIQRYAKKKGILFLTTPDGYKSLEYVDKVLNIPIIKISSTEITHLKFIDKVAKKKKPIILSTGISTLGEIERALQVIYQYHKKVTVLHCTSEYPASPEEVNLRAMITIYNAFKVKVGYSDHSLGFEASIAAVALGASVIEKHFTINKTLIGPDHKFSLSPQELKDFVKAIRKTEAILGDGIKRPMPSELKNIDGIRRSIVASRDLKKGTHLSVKDFTFKRPGYGVHPYYCERIVGMAINKNFVQDEPIEWKHLK